MDWGMKGGGQEIGGGAQAVTPGKLRWLACCSPPAVRPGSFLTALASTLLDHGPGVGDPWYRTSLKFSHYKESFFISSKCYPNILYYV